MVMFEHYGKCTSEMYRPLLHISKYAPAVRLWTKVFTHLTVHAQEIAIL